MLIFVLKDVDRLLSEHVVTNPVEALNTSSGAKMTPSRSLKFLPFEVPTGFVS